MSSKVSGVWGRHDKCIINLQNTCQRSTYSTRITIFALLQAGYTVNLPDLRIYTYNLQKWISKQCDTLRFFTLNIDIHAVGEKLFLAFSLTLLK